MTHHLGVERDHTRAGENHDNSNDAHADNDVSLRASLLATTNRRIWIERRMRADLTQHRFRLPREHEHAKQHSDTRRAEAPVPTDDLAQKSRDELPGKRTEIDTHVKDREARITARSAFGIELADDGRNVRLQETRAEDDQNQSDEERQFPVRER